MRFSPSRSPSSFCRRRWSNGPRAVCLIGAFAIGAAGGGGKRAVAGSLETQAAGHGVTVFQRSAYTTIDLSHCKKTRIPDGAFHVCKGLPGYPIYVAEGDLRAFVAASTAPQRSRSAEQTLGAFNTPFKDRSQRAPIEWRFVIKDGKQVPYATILRYYTQNDTARGEVLVVMKVAGPETCHVAHIDAVSTPDAIVLARDIADRKARQFDCRMDPEIAGVRGQSPM